MKDMPLSQLVNSVGKYMYKHIDSANKLTFYPNMCDVYFTIYYQVPGEIIQKYNVPDDELHEMQVDVNITTYQNKIRVNITEVDALERTLGSVIVKPVDFPDVAKLSTHIYTEICKKVAKAYEDYEFVF